VTEHYWAYALAGVLFVAGFLIGRGTEKRIIKSVVDALNMDRVLGEGIDKKQRLIVDKGKIKGHLEETITVVKPTSIVDFKNKTELTEAGEIPLTEERIAELRKLPQFRKTAI